MGGSLYVANRELKVFFPDDWSGGGCNAIRLGHTTVWGCLVAVTYF